MVDLVILVNPNVMRILLLFFLVSNIIFAISCRSAKKIQTAISKKDTSQLVVAPPNTNPKTDSIIFIHDAFQRIEANWIDFQTFSAKVKVYYEGGDGKNYDFNALIRMQKNKVIWVSINAVFGIEAFRVLITPDSVKLLNKLEKIAEFRSVSYLQDVIHLPLDFTTLQNLIIGNPVYLDSNIVFYRKEERGLSLMSVGQFFRNYITINKNDFTLQHSKLDDTDDMRARTCDLTYGEYEQRDKIHFSTYRKISVAEKSKEDIQIAFKQFNFNETLSFPFTIPKNYKRN
jgi:Domain of unknown function (DUF4292)